MSKIYRVCSGATTQVITVTLSTVGGCVFWYNVWADYHDNEYYRQKYRVTLSEQAASAFTYNYLYSWSITKNGAYYNTGQSNASVTVPAGVLTYDWWVTCKSDIGQPAGSAAGSSEYPPAVL